MSWKNRVASCTLLLAALTGCTRQVYLSQAESDSMMAGGKLPGPDELKPMPLTQPLPGRHAMRSVRCSGALLLTLLTWHARPVLGGAIDFTRDVRPILSRHCFKCHGPDEKVRKAKLRLDMRAAATGEAKWARGP